MKKKILTLLVLTILCIPYTVHASIFCDYTEKVRLKNLASNINKSYDYVETEDKAIFKITLSNVYKELYLKRKDTEEVFYPNSNQAMSEMVFENYESGKSYAFEIYTTHVDCEGDLLETLYIPLPTYNPYYKLPVCAGLDDYDLCSKWSNHGLTKEKFIETVTNYRNEKGQEEEQEESKTQIPYWIEFYARYYYILLPIIIIGLGIAIYKLNKKETFF